jgi:hypothetical protein
MPKITLSAPKRGKGRPNKEVVLRDELLKPIELPKEEKKPGYKEIIVEWQDAEGKTLRRMYSNHGHGEGFKELAEGFMKKVGGKEVKA